jgi:CBS domain-containing protein
MTFIVSFKGQFKPYELPDLSHYDRIHHIYKVDPSKKVLDHEDGFEAELNKAQGHSNKQKLKSGVGNYQKAQKQFEQNKVPHFARDLMSKPVHCNYMDENFQDILKTMEKFHYRHIPILNREEVLVGMVSDRDMLKLTYKENHEKDLIENFMTPEVLTAQTNTRIQDIAKIMLHEKISCIPIIDHKHVMVGIITQSDILAFVTRTLPIDLLT